MSSLKVLLCYDIKDNKTRARLAKYLETIAYRLQESVFIGDMNNREILMLQAVIQKIVEDEEYPNFFLIPLCNNCIERVWKLGELREKQMPSCLVI